MTKRMNTITNVQQIKFFIVRMSSDYDGFVRKNDIFSSIKNTENDVDVQVVVKIDEFYDFSEKKSIITIEQEIIKQSFSCHFDEILCRRQILFFSSFF